MALFRKSGFLLVLALGLGTGAFAKDPPPLGARTTHRTSGRSVTFGIENEFVPKGPARGLIDETTMEVDLDRVPFAYLRGTRENRRGADSTNHLEINGLPVSSLDEAMDQMRHVLRVQGVDPNKPPPPKSETGARSFHLHIFVPMEFFESLPPAERTAAVRAFSARMSDVLMARRLAVDPFLALSTDSVGWLPPKFAGERGATRMLDRPDLGVYDFEIRGTRIDLSLMQEFAQEIVQVAREPQRLANSPADLQTAMHLQAQTLSEFMDTYGKKLTPADAKLLAFLRKATKGMGADLPLHRFDEIPLFAKQKGVIEAANEAFARNVADFLGRVRLLQQPLSADAERKLLSEYRQLIQRWGNDVKLTELLGPKYLYPDPKELPSKEAQQDFLAKRAFKSYLVHEANGEVGRAAIAVDALSGTKSPQGQRLLLHAIARGPDGPTRIAAALALHGAPTETLVEVISHTTGKTRDAAIDALAKSSNSDRFEKLLPMLADPERKLAVLEALRGVDGPDVVPALVETVLARGDTALDRNAKQAAYQALAGRSDAMSLDALKTGLLSNQHSINIAATNAFEGRTDVASILFVRSLLGRTPNNPRIPDLIKALRNNPNGDELRSLYLEALMSPFDGPRRGVASAVTHRNEPWVHNMLLTLAKDPSANVRETLMKWLVVRFNDPKAVEIFRLGLEDSSETVRRMAFETLVTRTDAASVALVQEVVAEQGGLVPTPGDRPKLGPRLTPQEFPRYVDVVRAGRSLYGLCTDLLSVLALP